MAGGERIELPSSGSKPVALTVMLTPNMAGEAGFEPTKPESESGGLPLAYSPI